MFYGYALLCIIPLSYVYAFCHVRYRALIDILITIRFLFDILDEENFLRDLNTILFLK